jgi:dUTP pyrophosphatase
MAIVKIINTSTNPLPQYETTGSAGMDVRANIETPIVLHPMERTLVPTGLFIELPIGYEMQVRPRSGLAFKKGITVVNSPGTIDSDYRGEIKVLLINLSSEVQHIEPSERIAQLVVAAYETVQWDQTNSLEESSRGAGGFGSTGIK